METPIEIKAAISDDAATDAAVRPVARTAAVVYGVLVLLAIAVPQALPNWLNRFDPSALQLAFSSAAQAVRSAATGIGADTVYVHGRRIFLDLTGKTDD